MTSAARPRHSRKEIRDFADWLVGEGWSFETTDASGHTIWSHPAATHTYKLPETPRRFDVQRARRDVYRLMGRRVEGKRRRPKTAVVPSNSDPQIAASRRRHATTMARQEAARQDAADRLRRRTLAAAQSGDDDRRRRDIESLMRPGYGR